MPRTFKSNQVSQVYVVTNSTVPTALPSKATLDSFTVGSVAAVSSTLDDCLYFIHKGHGGLTRSDFIPVKNIEFITTGNEASGIVLHDATISINAAALESSNPIVGQPYTLRVELQGIGGSADDSRLIKFGTTMAVKGDDAPKLIARLLKSLQKNLANESAFVTVTSPTTTTIKIQEVVPEWIPNHTQQVTHPIKVYPSIVTTSGGEEVYWADVSYNNGASEFTGGYPETAAEVAGTGVPKVLGNKTVLADMERFYMGERADKYRMVGYPNFINTKYILDGTADGCTLDIHYSFKDSNETSYKSEKDIVFVGPRAAITALRTGLNTLIGSKVTVPTVPPTPTAGSIV